MNRLSHLCLLAALSFCIFGCSAAKKNFSEGVKLEKAGQYEEAMFKYAEAFRHDPTAPEYRMKYLGIRQSAAVARAARGDKLFSSGKYADALAEYQTAAGLAPEDLRYSQKVIATTAAISAEAAYTDGLRLEKENKPREAVTAYTRALEATPKNQEYQKALQRVTEQRKPKYEGNELQLKSHKPITLSFRDTKLGEVFKVISQLSGINFIFDDGLKEPNVTITFERATFFQALDLLTGMYKLGHKTLNESTVILYSRTPEKVKQYEDMVLRTFHLNHIDAKKAINMVRSMIQIRKVYVNDEANALVMRDTPDVIAVAEKLLEANDVPDAEVVLEMEILEVNDKDAKNLGLLLNTNSVSLAGFTSDGKALSSSLFSDNSSLPGVDTSQLLKAFNIKGFGGYVTVPNATYNFGKNLSRGEVLSNPKLRVKNREKAKFNVGQRVPVQTSTTVNTTTSSSVQYVDVGVKVNAEPNIQLNNEISIKLGLEVSSVINKETAKDGTTLVTIGTRNLETTLSLKNGETSVIGGLIQHGSSDDKVKLFLLSDIPLIGPLLSSDKTEKTKTELLLAVTPRLVRGITLPDRSSAIFSSGREDDATLRRPYTSFDQSPPAASTGKATE